MEIESVLALFRGMERLLIVFGAIISIILGWNLFKVRMISSQKAEFSAGDWSIKFISVGPGAFFVLFGAAILYFATTNSFSISSPQNIESGEAGKAGYEVKYGSGSKNTDELFKIVQALGSLAEDASETENFSSPQVAMRFYKYKYEIEIVRNKLIQENFSQEDLRIWREYKNDFRAGNKIEDEEVYNIVKDIEAWKNAKIHN